MVVQNNRKLKTSRLIHDKKSWKIQSSEYETLASEEFLAEGLLQAIVNACPKHWKVEGN